MALVHNSLRIFIHLSISLLVALMGGCELSPESIKNDSTNHVSPKTNLSFDFSSPDNTYKKLCTDEPSLWIQLMDVGHQLGVKIIFGKPELPSKDATYKAIYGQLGVLTLTTREMTDEVRCQLFSHEFIHVLQHLNENLKGVEPLGWPISTESLAKFGSAQEAEAYTYQNRGEFILQLLLSAKKQLQ